MLSSCGALVAGCDLRRVPLNQLHELVLVLHRRQLLAFGVQVLGHRPRTASALHPPQLYNLRDEGSEARSDSPLTLSVKAVGREVIVHMVEVALGEA